MSYGCLKVVSRVFQVTKLFQALPISVPRVFQGCFKDALKVYQGSSKSVLRLFQGCFKDIVRVI